jgi:hypothetical protein
MSLLLLNLFTVRCLSLTSAQLTIDPCILVLTPVRRCKIQLHLGLLSCYRRMVIWRCRASFWPIVVSQKQQNISRESTPAVKINYELIRAQ